MIRLRPVEEKDLPRLLDWRNQPSVRSFMFNSHVIGKEEHYQWFAELQNDASRRAFICEDENDIPFGFVQYKQIDLDRGTAHWGFFVGVQLRKGIGVEMGRAAIQYAAESLGLEALYGEVLVENEKSRRFHEKLGFELFDSVEDKERGAKTDLYRLVIAGSD